MLNTVTYNYTSEWLHAVQLISAVPTNSQLLLIRETYRSVLIQYWKKSLNAWPDSKNGLSIIFNEKSFYNKLTTTYNFFLINLYNYV